MNENWTRVLFLCIHGLLGFYLRGTMNACTKFYTKASSTVFPDFHQLSDNSIHRAIPVAPVARN